MDGLQFLTLLQKVFFFILNLGSVYPTSFGLFADHGIVPFGFAVSNFLAETNQKKKIDMFILAGDVCYCDLGSNGKHEFQSLWDLYQNQIEKLASVTRNLKINFSIHVYIWEPRAI
jgi:hypothetical protein